MDKLVYKIHVYVSKGSGAMVINLICISNKIMSPRIIDDSFSNDIDTVYFYIDKNKQNRDFAIQFVMSGGVSSFCMLKQTQESNQLYNVYKVDSTLIDLRSGAVKIRVIEYPKSEDPVTVTDFFELNLDFKNHNSLAKYSSIESASRSIASMYQKVCELT